MILAGREAGDLAERGSNQHSEVIGTTDNLPTLAELGIQKDLAADAVAFARLHQLDPRVPWPHA